MKSKPAPVKKTVKKAVVKKAKPAVKPSHVLVKIKDNKKKEFVSDTDLIIRRAPTQEEETVLGDRDIQSEILNSTLKMRQNDDGGFEDPAQVAAEGKKLIYQFDDQTSQNDETTESNRKAQKTKIQARIDNATGGSGKLILPSRNSRELGEEVKKFKFIANPYDRAIAYSMLVNGVDRTMIGIRIATKLEDLTHEVLPEIKGAVCLAAARGDTINYGELDGLFGSWTARVVDEFEGVNTAGTNADLRSLQAFVLVQTDKITELAFARNLNVAKLQEMVDVVRPISAMVDSMDMSIKDRTGFYACIKDFSEFVKVYYNAITKKMPDQTVALKMPN